MKKSGVLTLLILTFTLAIGREEILEPSGAYIIRWDVDFAREIVTFEATVRTTGFIGFGISNGGGMLGADIVIGGVFPNGTKYFGDFHGEGSFGPILDDIQNWDLLDVFENSTHTRVWFSRPFDTKDVLHDTPITTAPTHFIWSFGPTDRILYHGPNRGSFEVKVLDVLQ